LSFKIISFCVTKHGSQYCHVVLITGRYQCRNDQ